MTILDIDRIRQFFETYQYKKCENRNLIRAAVLILLFERNKKIHIVLTRRTLEVEHHKGQVSFPGGMSEDSDATIVDTALREAEEEIGLAKKSVDILGILSDYPTYSGFCVTPVIAFLASPPIFSINKREVSEIFDVPMSFFLDSGNMRVEQRLHNDKIIDVYFYTYENYDIWGVTAGIIHSFLSVLTR